MPKRKRSLEEDVEQTFEAHRQEVFRALKMAKGHERQRLAKRMKDADLSQERLSRLETEVLVLKSLDLMQTAHAHLCSAMLKVKVVANSPDLPPRLKRGIPKPDVSEEERVALHNVTSAMYQRKEVRDVVTKAITGICQMLSVTPPGSKGKEKKEVAPAKTTKREQSATKVVSSTEYSKAGDESSWDGFDSAPEDDANQADEIDSSMDEKEEEEAVSRLEAMLGGSSSEEEEQSSDDELDEELEEKEVSRLESMLGGSSSEDEGGGDDGGINIRSRERDFEDDISLPGSDSMPEDMSSDSESPSASPSPSLSPEPQQPPQKKESKEAPKKEKKEKTAASSKTERATNSTFLPSLMSGYISGSESASDVDVAPAVRKNRRGQKARQAIWEKRYGEKAKHLAAPARNDKRRDAGWDPKRGAVEAGDGKPWKKGVRNPLASGGGAGGEGKGAAGEADKGKGAKGKEKKRDDTGPLHPSWEARKKAKKAESNATFQGKKITFD